MPATAPHRSGATAASDVFSAIDSVPARAIPAASSSRGSRPHSEGMSRAGRVQVALCVQARGEGRAVCGEGGAAEHRPGRGGGRERVRRRAAAGSPLRPPRRRPRRPPPARRRRRHPPSAGRRTTAVPTRRRKSRSPRRGATGPGSAKIASATAPSTNPTARDRTLGHATDGPARLRHPARRHALGPPNGSPRMRPANPARRPVALRRSGHNTPAPTADSPRKRSLTAAKPQLTGTTADPPRPKARTHRGVRRRLAVTERRLRRREERRLATERRWEVGALLPSDGLTQPQPVAPLRLAGDGVQRTRPPRPRARGRAAPRTPAEPVGLVRDQQPPPHLGHARHHVRDRLVVPLRRSVHETCTPSDPPRRRAAAEPDGAPVDRGDGTAAATYRARPLTLRAPPVGAPRG